jgi:aromatic-L-amino-acid decarboxylase
MYVRDPDRLVRTLTIMPEYLRAAQNDSVINYRDWHIPLGRRFRALKLWFVLRHYGARGLRHHIAEHVRLAALFENWIVHDENDRFELVTPRSLNLVCFRLRASDEVNQQLLNRINEAGRIHLTHTRLNDVFTLRMCIGQTNTREEHIAKAWHEIQHHAGNFNHPTTSRARQ